MPKKKTAAFSESFAAVMENMDKLHAETDRGVVLIATAWYEEYLEILMRGRMAPTPSKLIDRLFDAHGPLSTFSSKLLMCHALGLVDSSLYKDLEIIRRLRNQFAHQYAPANLSDHAVLARLGEMAVIQSWTKTGALADVDPGNGRQLFASAATYWLGYLQSLAGCWEEEGKKRTSEVRAVDFARFWGSIEQELPKFIARLDEEVLAEFDAEDQDATEPG